MEDIDNATADIIAVLEVLGLPDVPKYPSGQILQGEELIHLFIHAVDDETASRDEFRRTLAALARTRISRGDFRRRRREMKNYKTAMGSYPCLSEHVGPQGLYVQIQCSKCGRTDSRRLKQKDISPEHVLIPGFRKGGWEVKKKGKEAFCPSCATSRAPNQPMSASLLEQQAAKENEKRRKEQENTKPQLEVVRQVPELPVQTIETPSVPTYETEFKRHIVEQYEQVPEGEHTEFLRKNKVSSARHAAWKRAYLEGRLGELSVVVSLRAPSKPFRCVDRRHFTEEFKRRVVEEASLLSADGRLEYLKCRALTESLYSRWKDKFMPVQPVAVQPVADPKIQFQLFQLLQDNFDKDRHCYKTGWDDARCAKELGIAVSYVQEVREEVFGSVRNPEAEAIHQDLQTVKERMTRDLKELQELLTTFKDEYERQIEALSDRLTAAERSA